MKQALAILALLAAPMAIAHAQPGGALERLRAADLNGDGAITRAEARTGRETAFRAMDTDNDGFVTAAEKEARRAEAAKKRGDRGAGGDTDGDGKVSRAEFLNAPYRIFDRLDANRNDTIEAAELETARTMLLQRKQGTP